MSRVQTVLCLAAIAFLTTSACDAEVRTPARRVEKKMATSPPPVVKTTARASLTKETAMKTKQDAPTILASTTPIPMATAPGITDTDDDGIEISADLKMGVDVVDRLPVELPATVEGDSLVYAWTNVKGLDDGVVQHVWYRNGRELRRFELPVENARRWRTWSIVKVKSGRYGVKILGPKGELLAEDSFEVPEPTQEDGTQTGTDALKL